LSALLCIVTGIHAQPLKPALNSGLAAPSDFIKSREFSAEMGGVIIPQTADLLWTPILTTKCIKQYKHNDSLLEQIKNSKNLMKQLNVMPTASEEKVQRRVAAPVMGSNFEGNRNNGYSPMDNSIATSNSGYIVSVSNTLIQFYNTNGQLLYTRSIATFFNDANISSVCDPVVLYDAGENKFVFFAQECSGSSANSHLLICFSTSDNPNDAWYRYKITGNPLNNNTWFDYPKMAVSTNELYISGNAFTNNGTFDRALLYQINKKAGFSGQSLNYQYWQSLKNAPFTLLPVSGGQGNYGPGCYLVSTSPSGGSSINLYDLTDDMSASDETINHYSISTKAYSPSGDGSQKGSTRKIDNGDCRSLSGFYLNGIIHFVFHSDYQDGYSGINYNRLDVVNKTNISSPFGLTGYEYAYPAVASSGNSSTDKSVLIGFLRTGANIYPEIRAVNCDNNIQWSSSILIKSGEGFSSYISPTSKPERWGDYTGIARRYNSTGPTLWMNGMYGSDMNVWETWIASIGQNPASIHQSNSNVNKPATSPNPIIREFVVSFQNPITTDINISIYDSKGSLVANLFNGICHAGDNAFSFNKTPLKPGTYQLIIASNDNVLKNEKIIIAE
jgi:hypothetical protein